MKFYIKQKVFSLRDTFNIFDVNQNPVYQVKGQFFSMKNKMTLMDMDERPILSSEKKIFSLRPTYFIFDQSGTQIAKVRQRWSFRPKFDVEIYGKMAHLDGSLFGYNFTIESDANFIASMSKKVISWGDSYEIEIEDKENLEVYLYLVIVIDQVLHERKNKSHHN